MMKRNLAGVLICSLVLSCFYSEAQYYFYNDKYYNTDWVFELGASPGVMNSLTDIGGRRGVGKNLLKDINWKFSKPGFSIYAVTTWHDVIALRFEATSGRIASYDSVLRNVGPSTIGRYERNLSFKSNVSEIAMSAEVYPLLFISYYKEDQIPLWSPYVSAGMGYYHFNPQAQLNGRWYDLQPLHTEGQGFNEFPDRDPYKLTQLNISLGIGVRYEISAIFNARIELSYRILFTDYLDDVSHFDYIDPSLFDVYLPPTQAAIARNLYARARTPGINNQRGNPKNNDSYFTIQLKLSYVFRRQQRQ